MGWLSDDSYEAQAYEEVTSAPHRASLSHELIAGAATYEAAKAYENHKARYGEPDSHAKAKEIMAGFAGAFVDRIVETKGLDYIDQARAKQHARQQINRGYESEVDTQESYTSTEYVQQDYVQKDYVQQDYVQQDYVQQDYVQQDYVERDYVQQESFTNEEDFQQDYVQQESFTTEEEYVQRY